MNIYVLDTSALIRVFLPDGPIPAGVESALREGERGQATVLCPELARVEIGQVLLKKVGLKTISVNEAHEILAIIGDLPIRWCGHGALMARALALALERKLTVYDACFLSLAERYGAVLFTADSALNVVAVELGLG